MLRGLKSTLTRICFTFLFFLAYLCAFLLIVLFLNSLPKLALAGFKFFS